MMMYAVRSVKHGAGRIVSLRPASCPLASLYPSRDSHPVLVGLKGIIVSLDATRWAWQKALSPSQKLVLLSLADRANENHICFPSIPRLEFDTGLNRKTIMSAIQEMALMGILVVQKENGKGNHYKLIGVEDRNQYQKRDRYQKRPVTSTKNGTRTSTKSGTLIYKESIKEPAFSKEGESQNRKALDERLADLRKAVGLKPKE